MRFEAGERRRVVHLGFAGFMVVWATGLAVTGAPVQLVFLNLWAAACQVLTACVMPRFGVVLSPAGITLRGWSTRHYPWSQVQSIEGINFLWARRTQVRLTTGSKIRTWAPYDDFLLPDLKFEQRVEALQHWHVHYVSDRFVVD